MARTPEPPYLVELRNPTSTATQIQALHRLKIEAIGHDQRKELLIRHGVAGVLASILNTVARSNGKRKRNLDGELNGNAGQWLAGESGNGLGSTPSTTPWREEDEVRLQATIIVGSFAHAGPAFMAPILAAGILHPLFAALSSGDVAPRLVIATLRTLIVVANTIPFIRSDQGSHDAAVLHPLPNELYSKTALDYIKAILSQQDNADVVHQQIGLVAQLISSTCRKAEWQNLLVKYGILDLLAYRLAAIVVRDGMMAPGADAAFISTLLEPPSSVDPFPILRAIGTIVDGSYYRTARFLYSPAITGVFPVFSKDEPLNDGLQDSNLFSHLLPRLPDHTAARFEQTFSKSFPALGALVSPGDLSRLTAFAELESPFSERPSPKPYSQDHDSMIFAWLVHLARTEKGMNRLVAVWVLHLLVELTDEKPCLMLTGLTNKVDDRMLPLLVVPLVVKLLDQAQEQPLFQSPYQQHLRTSGDGTFLGQSCVVLSKLISGRPMLQKAAVDAGAVKKLCQILKKSFDPLEPQKPMWSPHGSRGEDLEVEADRTTLLGDAGYSAARLNQAMCRHGALLALASIASHKDDSYRKMIVDAGVIPQVVESLKPVSQPNSGDVEMTDARPTQSEGSDLNVVVSACNLIRAVSRSVSILRTSLIDADIVKPIYALLTHSNIMVKIAATNVCCNLLMDFSAMKEELVEMGIMRILCQHCHSANPTLRIVSLWALKHLVNKSEIHTKLACLEELGTGWLVQTISGENCGERALSRPHLGTSNAAHEPVDILNDPDTHSLLDVDMEADLSTSEDEDEDLDVMTDSIGALTHIRTSSLRSTSNPHRARLKQIKNYEFHPVTVARREDIQIQEQGLDFVRNLMNGPGNTQMIEHLLQTIGVARFFEIILSKLRPIRSPQFPTFLSPLNTADKRPSGPSRQPSGQFASSPGGQAQYYQPAEIILAAVFVLVHFAAGQPKHRAQLIAQKELLRLVLPLFGHHDRRIRVSCVWMTNNLTWVDDQGDQYAARQRAMDLKQQGFEEAIKKLLNDNDLDIRERAKTGIEQLSKLIDGPGQRFSQR